MQGRQVGVASASFRFDFDRLLYFRNSADQVAHPGRRISEQHQRFDVSRLALEDPQNPGLGILKLPCCQQIRRGLDLRLVVVRQQVGRADLLGVGRHRIANLHVGFGELVARLA
jgi:hypothetical protein